MDDVMRSRMDAFRQALRERGFKETAQRDDIAHVFFRRGGHLSVEELHLEVKRVNPRVGYATVYRTVRLLRDLGFAAERHFDDGQARYELVRDEHHDHLICERCGKIVEFQNERIESLQELVARDRGFVLSHHRMELYGICRECREGHHDRARRPASRRTRA